ncbi:MAG: sulfotransferase domain-containing protein [Acidimicrobiia bacterium]
MIGAQRSGTTWFTGLLTQHPEVSLVGGLDKAPFMTPSLVTGTFDGFDESYLGRFRDVAGKVGECAAAYLRCSWVPPIARRLCSPDVVLVVLLRDPVERFASAMRMKLSRTGPSPQDGITELHRWSRLHGPDAQWGGMYATQLAAWEAAFERRHLIVLQYERVASRPAQAVSQVWSELDLDDIPIEGTDTPSASSSPPTEPWSWDLLPGFRETLIEMYRPEVRRLQQHWNIDPRLWPNYS